jgi:hypothetical protein
MPRATSSQVEQGRVDLDTNCAIQPLAARQQQQPLLEKAVARSVWATEALEAAQGMLPTSQAALVVRVILAAAAVAVLLYLEVRELKLLAQAAQAAAAMSSSSQSKENQ